jgi:hypothetical protein
MCLSSLVVNGFCTDIVVLYLCVLCLISSSHIPEAVAEVICIRANNSRCKFYCGQDVLDLSDIDGSSVQPR